MKTLRQFTNILRKNFPIDRPVKVRTIVMPYSNKSDKLRFFGDVQEYDKYYIIRINKECELSVQKDTLMHEWAHCMAGWDNDNDSHSDKWGKCYANIFRIMVGD